MSDTKTGLTDNPGGSIFWIIWTAVTLIGLVWLSIWSYHNDSIQGIALFAIFSIMILIGLIFSRMEVFRSGGWGENSLAFMVGLVMWLIIGGLSSNNAAFSFLSISTNELFAAISGEMPRLLEFVMNSFVIPLAEEMLWIIGIPFTMIWIFSLLGKKYKVFKNPWLQLILIALVSGITFAAFHVGKLFLAFLIAAFIFRSIMIFGVIGDMKLDLIPGIKVLPAFALGAHIGNNWAAFGFVDGWRVMSAEPVILFIVGGLLLAVLLGSLNQGGLWLKKIGFGG